MTAPWSAGIRPMVEAVRSGAIQPRLATTLAIARRQRLDGALHAFVPALAAAATAPTADRGHGLGPLADVPFAHGDDLLRQGEPTSACSRMLAGFRAPTTATVLARMMAAGAVPIGATNHDEFGLGAGSTTSCHGATANPFDTSRLAGSGAGAAVAADVVPLAVASDAGGAVRHAASWCGVTGLKPTRGRVSRAGLVAVVSSFECIGALARSAEDLAAWLDVVAGPDPADPTTTAAAAPVLPTLSGRSDLRGLRLGLPWQLNGPGLDDDVVACTTSAAAAAEHLGASLVDNDLAGVEHAIAAWLVLSSVEATSNLARFDGILWGARRERSTVAETIAASRSAGFGDDVQLRLLLGSHLLAVDPAQLLERARVAQTHLVDAFANAFAHCDLLLAATTPMPALPHPSPGDDPLPLLLAEALTVPASLAGLPALSMPCGRSAEGLPIGLQLIAPAGREDLLLQVAHVLQQGSDHHLQRPCP